MTDIDNDTKLKDLISQILGCDISEVNDETSMSNTLSWDSLKHMEIIIAIEDEFKIPKLVVADIVLMIKVSVIKEILHSKGVRF